MRIALVLSVLGVAGCDRVFHLSGRDAPPADVDGGVIDVPIDASAVDCPKDPLRIDDEDDDDFPNSCDNCPHQFQTDQADGDFDGVGDPCDPRQDLRDHIDYFDGFDGTPPGLDLLPAGAWHVAGGRLVTDGVPEMADRIARLKHGLLDAVVYTRLTIIKSTGPNEAAGVFAWIAQPTPFGSELYPQAILFQIAKEATGPLCRLVQTFPLAYGTSCGPQPDLFDIGRTYSMRLDCVNTPIAQCAATATYDGANGMTTVNSEIIYPSVTGRTGPLGLRAYAVDVAFDYIVVIAHD